jgi:hypothetical protein
MEEIMDITFFFLGFFDIFHQPTRIFAFTIRNKKLHASFEQLLLLGFYFIAIIPNTMYMR